MKIFSLGNFDKKIFLFLLLYIIIVTSINLIDKFYFSTPKTYQINFSLWTMVHYGFGIFYFVPEIIIRKLNKKKEEVSNINRNNNILYLFFKPKKIIFKGITFLILIFILNIAYLYFSTILLAIHSTKLYIFDIGNIRAFEIIYFLLLSLILDKIKFYRHQYISPLIMIIMNVIRFIINIKQVNDVFNFPEDLLFLFFGIIFSLIESVLYFIIQKFMKNKFYSPFFIHFLMGTISSIFTLIIYFIFMNVDCGENSICLILSQETKIEKKDIIVLVINSFIYSLYYFLVIVLIYNFSVFHWFLFATFEVLIQTLFSFSDYTVLEQIILIVTFIIEIFAILVFIEIIILNFCGLNYNIKKNIIFRADYEIHQLEKADDIDGSDDDSIIRENLVELNNYNDNNENNEKTLSNY